MSNLKGYIVINHKDLYKNPFLYNLYSNKSTEINFRGFIVKAWFWQEYIFVLDEKRNIWFVGSGKLDVESNINE